MQNNKYHKPKTIWLAAAVCQSPVRIFLPKSNHPLSIFMQYFLVPNIFGQFKSNVLPLELEPMLSGFGLHFKPSSMAFLVKVKLISPAVLRIGLQDVNTSKNFFSVSLVKSSQLHVTDVSTYLFYNCQICVIFIQKIASNDERSDQIHLTRYLVGHCYIIASEESPL